MGNLGCADQDDVGVLPVIRNKGSCTFSKLCSQMCFITETPYKTEREKFKVNSLYLF